MMEAGGDYEAAAATLGVTAGALKWRVDGCHQLFESVGPKGKEPTIIKRTNVNGINAPNMLSTIARERKTEACA